MVYVDTRVTCCGFDDDAWTESQFVEKEVPRRQAVLGLNDHKDDNDNDDDKMVVIVSGLMTCDIEVNHQGEEIEGRKDVRFTVYGAVLWQPSVLSHRALKCAFCFS